MGFVVNEIKKKENIKIGVALRLAQVGQSTPIEICDSYWGHVKRHGHVLFGCKTNSHKHGTIDKVVLFGHGTRYKFIVCADVERVICDIAPFNPINMYGELEPYILPTDRTKKYKTWFVLTNFRQISFSDFKVTLLNSEVLFTDKVESAPRFPSCLISLENFEK